MRLKSTVFIFWLWLSAIAARCQAPATLQLIRDVRVFDGEHVFEHRSVLLEDGKISRIGGSELKVTNAEVVDGRGRTLLPGLIDAHVHLPNPVEKASRQALVLGVTTQLDMFNGGYRLKLIKKFESEIARILRICGPREREQLSRAGIPPKWAVDRYLQSQRPTRHKVSWTPGLPKAPTTSKSSTTMAAPGHGRASTFPCWTMTRCGRL